MRVDLIFFVAIVKAKRERIYGLVAILCVMVSEHETEMSYQKKKLIL